LQGKKVFEIKERRFVAERPPQKPKPAQTMRARSNPRRQNRVKVCTRAFLPYQKQKGK
jgi:hypothetical protein